MLPLIAVLSAHLVLFRADVVRTPLVPGIGAVTHRIFMRTITGRGHCSATAIGPYALLIASHCEEPTDKIRVDMQWATIHHLVRDDFDHTILYLSDTDPFDQWARVKVIVPEQGSFVAMAGNPGMGVNLYRSGTFSGILDQVLGDIYLFNFVSYIGDSGSGLFAEDGTLYAVESLLVNLSDDPEVPFKMPAAYPLRFTDAQWAEALTFQPPPGKLPLMNPDPRWLFPIPN